MHHTLCSLLVSTFRKGGKINNLIDDEPAIVDDDSSNFIKSILNEIIDNVYFYVESGAKILNSKPSLYCKPDLTNFNFSVEKSSSNLRIFYSNVRGFNSKREVIMKIAIDLDIDCMIFCETHNSQNFRPILPSFKTFFRNRRHREKGGVAIFVKESLARNAIENEY